MPIWITIPSIVAMLGLLLFDARTKDHVMQPREAWLKSGLYVGLGLLYGILFWVFGDTTAAAEYYGAYGIEKMLSVDNLMVMMTIFAYFGVKREYRHKALLYGIFGAIIMRVLFITIGAAFVAMFTWLLLAFAAVLLFAAYKIFFQDEDDDYKEGRIIALAKKYLRFTNEFDGSHFSTRVDDNGNVLPRVGGKIARTGKFVFTPMLLTVIALETSDLIFAMDSIPAGFAVTSNPEILIWANLWAICGLRALFFVVDILLAKLCYLNEGLGIVLGWIAVKMILHVGQEYHWTVFVDLPHVSTYQSLAIVFGILAVTVAASLLKVHWSKPGAEVELDPAGEAAADVENAVAAVQSEIAAAIAAAVEDGEESVTIRFSLKSDEDEDEIADAAPSLQKAAEA